MSDEESIMDILNGLNPSVAEKRPSDDLPTPKDKPLTPAQQSILSELPDEKGFYWIEHNYTGRHTVADIDKSHTVDTVEHWGHVFHATPGGIAALERWLEQHTILTKIEPHKEANTYERNASYGMF